MFVIPVPDQTNVIIINVNTFIRVTTATDRQEYGHGKNYTVLHDVYILWFVRISTQPIPSGWKAANFYGVGFVQKTPANIFP